MLRKIININSHQFICDLYSNDEIGNSENKKEFVMLRNLYFNEYSISDNDIYIIDKSLIEDNTFNDIIFPIPNEILRFTTNVKNFVELTHPKAYNFYDKTGNTKKIKYDTVRIYHPLTFVNNLNFIVYIDNYINGIHFHYFCRKYTNIPYNSETEFKVNNNVYSEYITFDIPNINDLISKTTFFKEDTTSCLIKDNKYKSLIFEQNNDKFCSTYLFNIPYYLENGKKIYLPESVKTIETNYYTYPINITLYAYIDEESGVFTPNIGLPANSGIFVSAPRISLTSNLDFNTETGKMKVKLNFNYPNKDKFNTLQDAYEFYNNISISEYENIYYEEDDDDYDETDDHKMYQCVYKLEIAANQIFTNIIYTSPNIAGDTLLNEITNKEFDIPLFTEWDQIPEILVCRVQFIDRYLGLSLISNINIISKEKYKYIVKNDYNVDGIFRLNLNSIEDMEFIDKVSCIIKQDKPAVESISINSTPKIIYKPVFYRTQELQNIKIQSGVTQNIGINLNNYMSKVQSFFLTIGNNKFIESGRNDIFVIFNVEATKINGISGTYYITNQDDEYISSGDWSMI